MFKRTGKSHVWKILVLQLAFNVVGGEYPCRFTAAAGSVAWLREDGGLIFPSYLQGEKVGKIPPVPDDISDGFAGENRAENSSCRFSKVSNDLTCKDSIDFKFLKTMQEKRVRALTIDSYNSRGTMKKVTGRKRMEILAESSSENLVGELHFKDISIKMSTTVDLQMLTEEKYAIEGEVFSNRIVKVGWKYKGWAILSVSEEGITAEVTIESREYENGWKLDGIMEIDGNGGKFHGCLIYAVGTPSVIQYRGNFTTKFTGGERTVLGQVEAMDLNVVGYFLGRLTKYISAEITIPKGAFSGMSIQNLVFKDSYFFGDFHTHSLEGINGLEAIHFSKSRLEFMPDYSTIFRGPSIKAIYIEDCNTPTITTSGNCNVQLLELLSFKGSGFLEFSKKSFQWLTCSKLTFLNFHDTNFKLIGNDSILQPVSDTLKYLDISYSTLRHESGLRQILDGTRITHLSLAGLQLKRVPASALETVKDTVEYLSLRKNNFEKIPGENFLVPVLNFPTMSALKELDLQGCRINYVEKRAFDSLGNLEKLDLSLNNVVNLQDGWSEMKPNIIYLNLSHNGVATRASPINLLDVRDPFDLGVFDRLETLDLSNSDFWNSNRLIMNGNIKLRHLSLCKCGLRTLNDSLFEAMPNLEEMDLSGNPGLGKSVSLHHLKNVKRLNKLHLAYSSIANLTFGGGEEPLNDLEYLDLSNNYIKTIRPEFLKLMPNLKILKLSRNSVSYWPKNLLEFSPHLKIIHLDNNKMETLKSDSISTITSLDEFSFGGNPFLCGCYVLEFTTRLRKTKSGVYLCPESLKEAEPRIEKDNRIVRQRITLLSDMSNTTTRKVYLFKGGCARIRDWSEIEYQCYSSSLRRILPFVNVTKDFDECQENIDAEYFNWAYLMVTFSLLFSFFIGFLWWKWWNFRLFTKLMKNAAVLSFMEDGEPDKIAYEYDAFVSYTDRDRQWVTDQLIPTLEKMEDVKICLHERDFQVGLSILENIVTSIDKSRCIILVLSQAFVKSQWCQYEMHLAYHRLLETRRDQMILILLENIPRHKRPRTLQYLMMTKTYIQWPSNAGDKKEIEIFWNRLSKALTHINQI